MIIQSIELHILKSHFLIKRLSANI